MDRGQGAWHRYALHAAEAPDWHAVQGLRGHPWHGAVCCPEAMAVKNAVMEEVASPAVAVVMDSLVGEAVVLC